MRLAPLTNRPVQNITMASGPSDYPHLASMIDVHRDECVHVRVRIEHADAQSVKIRLAGFSLVEKDKGLPGSRGEVRRAIKREGRVGCPQQSISIPGRVPVTRSFRITISSSL